MKMLNYVGAGVLAMLLAVAGCGKNDAAPGGSGNAGGAPAGEPMKDEAIVGNWKVSSLQGLKREGAEALYDGFMGATMTFKADHTVRTLNEMVGGNSWTWSVNGDTLTLKKGEGSSDLMSAKQEFKLEGTHIVDRSSKVLVTTYEKAPDGPVAVAGKFSVDEYLALNKDKEAFKAKYLNKFVEIEGVVLNLNFGDHPVICLGTALPTDKTKDEMGLPQVMGFSVDPHPSMSVSRGQKVKIRGQAMEEFMYPSLREVEVIEAGPTTAVTISAEELGKAIKADAAAASAKYDLMADDGVSMTISGQVLSLVKNDAGKPRGVVLGTATASVNCVFNGIDATPEHLEKYKVGDQVVVYGTYHGGKWSDPQVYALHVAAAK